MTREEIARKALDALAKALQGRDAAEQAAEEIEAACKALSATGGDTLVEEAIESWSEIAKRIRSVIDAFDKENT